MDEPFQVAGPQELATVQGHPLPTCRRQNRGRPLLTLAQSEGRFACCWAVQEALNRGRLLAVLWSS